jgi:hypothetical protein
MEVGITSRNGSLGAATWVETQPIRPTAAKGKRRLLMEYIQ